MGGLILCRSEEAQKPYYMDTPGIYVYSLEELCYAIYNNIYLLNSDFADEKLIDFLRNETLSFPRKAACSAMKSCHSRVKPLAPQ